MSGAPRVAARAGLRKRGIKGSSRRCSRRGRCLRRWYVRCLSAVMLSAVVLAYNLRRCRPVRTRIACSAVPPACLLHSLRGGHRSLGVVVAATAELCVRRASLRLLTVHVRARRQNELASVKTLGFFDLPKRVLARLPRKRPASLRRGISGHYSQPFSPTASQGSTREPSANRPRS